MSNKSVWCRIVFIILIGTALPAPASGQDAQQDPRTTEERLYYFLSDEGSRTAVSLRGTPATQLADPLSNLFAFVYYSLPPRTLNDTYKTFLRFADQARVDQQVGSAAL